MFSLPHLLAVSTLSAQAVRGAMEALPVNVNHSYSYLYKQDTSKLESSALFPCSERTKPNV